MCIQENPDRVRVDVNAMTRGLYYCMHCSLCKSVLPSEMKSTRFSEVCPPGARHKFDAFFGSGRAGFYRAFLTGEIGFDDSPRLPEVLYKCQNCGACGITCRYTSALGQVDLERATEILRAKCVEDGLAPLEHSLMVEHLKREDNIFGWPKAERGGWAAGLPVKDIHQAKVDVLFHAGCRLSYDAGLDRVARSTVRVLLNSGLDVGIAGSTEPCCGGRAYGVGYPAEMVKYADDMLSTIKASGASTVVTACSDCFYTLKRLLPLVGRQVPIEVLHSLELVAQMVAKGRVPFREMVPLRVTYHDPCHIGRKLYPDFLYDAPRVILNEIPGVRLVEMERIRDCTWCCGAGAGVLEAYPELSEWAAAERIQEAMSTGAEAIVSACPWCERNFIDAVSKNDGCLRVHDVMELVDIAMGGNSNGNE